MKYFSKCSIAVLHLFHQFLLLLAVSSLWGQQSQSPLPKGLPPFEKLQQKVNSIAKDIPAEDQLSPLKNPPVPSPKASSNLIIQSNERTAKSINKNIRNIYAIFEIEYNKKVLGKFKAKLFHRRAPKTVANFVELAEGTKPFIDLREKIMVKRPFYDGLEFYKIIPRFMIVSGDPLNKGTGGPGFTIPDEIHPNLRHSKAGILSMINRGRSHSGGSQFFITLKKSDHLNKKYSIFGEVVEGMALVLKISKVRRDLEDRPLRPVILRSLHIERVYYRKKSKARK